MRVLFVKPSLNWPRTSGHDVYCYYMMKGLFDLDVEVSLATVEPLDPRAIEGIGLTFCGQLNQHPSSPGSHASLMGLQERFRSFWGISREDIESVRSIAAKCQADVVVAFGLSALPFLAGAERAVRVWAMADEWVYHHLSLVHPTDPKSWSHLKEALIKGLYERAYRRLVDRVWVVSDTDRRAARWFAGMPVADLLPNGVDTDFYRPRPEVEKSNSAIFWGRLDFEPNIDALRWFCQEIWPAIRNAEPTAKFSIVGYQPTAAVEALASGPGVCLHPNVEDLRAMVCQHELVVLPFISGGGIKNKLLEGAAMGRAIVCSPRACRDLRVNVAAPWITATTPDEWTRAVTDLWKDAARRAELGRLAREWVTQEYGWSIPARGALAGFSASIETRRRG
jgi:glycosyltransferase involved in cell wall biosynthesis